MATDKQVKAAADPAVAHERIDESAERFKRATSDKVERTHEALDRAADKVEHSLHHATDKVASAAGRGVDGAAAARERGREVMDDVVDKTSDWMDQARKYVREKPAQSVAIALAAGWLVGRLTRR